ncbi:MAG TPA: hypothetical protein DCZ95_04820 [Verrucomicrobia bacterium]|nr:hypothetical protein [Verrucomicrobiota bacterium]
MQLHKTLPWLALAAAIAGLLTTVFSLRSAPTLLKQISRRRADLTELQALRQERAGHRSALDLYEQLPTKKAVPLKDLAASAGLPPNPDIRWQDDIPAAEGWVLRAVDVRFESVRLADLARFLKLAQESRPPWRLRECALTAVGSAPGFALASLTMETLEKKAP